MFHNTCILNANLFHTIFPLNGKETVGISVQSQLKVRRWCIVLKQPRGQVYPAKLEIKCTTESTTSVSYLYLLLSIEMEWTSHFHLRQNDIISISSSQTFRAWVVIYHLRRLFNLSTYTTRPGLLLSWMFFKYWCSIVDATVTVHQFFYILHFRYCIR